MARIYVFPSGTEFCLLYAVPALTTELSDIHDRKLHQKERQLPKEGAAKARGQREVMEARVR